MLQQEQYVEPPPPTVAVPEAGCSVTTEVLSVLRVHAPSCNRHT